MCRTIKSTPLTFKNALRVLAQNLVKHNSASTFFCVERRVSETRERSRLGKAFSLASHGDEKQSQNSHLIGPSIVYFFLTADTSLSLALVFHSHLKNIKCLKSVDCSWLKTF